MSQPIPRPGAAIRLPLQWFGSVSYYAAAIAHGTVIIDDTLRFDKRFKSAHRTTVADTRGPLPLTVPTAKVASPATWHDIPLSAHGEWWRTHLVTLESGYGRTPFFEFYIDRLLPFFESGTVSRFPSVAMMDRAANDIVWQMLGLQNRLLYMSDIAPDENDKLPPVTALVSLPVPPRYRQIRADRIGFIPGLSILDLIFNLGPEAPLHLLSQR